LGGVSRRVAKLEEVSQDRAAAELRRAWANLTDWEVATVLAPYAEWVKTGEQTEEEKEVWEMARAAMPSELIAQAIVLTDCMNSEEIDRRIGQLVQTLGILERGDGIRRHMQSTRERRR
jgi:hypothetical protein